MFGSSDDVILDITVQLSEIGAVASHTNQKVGELCRTCLCLTQCLAIHHVELSVPASDVAESPDKRSHTMEAFRIRHGLW